MSLRFPASWRDLWRGHQWIAVVAIGCLAFTTSAVVLLRLAIAALEVSVVHDLGSDVGEVTHVVTASNTAYGESRSAMNALDRALHETRRARIERQTVVLDVAQRRRPVELLGVSVALPALQRVTMHTGRWFAEREERGARDVVVLGQELVDSLYRGEAPRRLRVADRWLEVIGVVETGPATAVSLNEALVVPGRLLQRLVHTAPAQVEMLIAEFGGDGVRARAKTVDDAWAVLDRRHWFRGRLVRVSSVDRLGDAAKLSETLHTGADHLALLLLSASLAAVTSLMFTIARGQSRAVGIRRAIGATRVRVVTQGACIGAGVGMLGVVLGALIAVLVALITSQLAHIPLLPPAIVLDVLVQVSALPLATCIAVGALCFASLARRTPAQLLA